MNNIKTNKVSYLSLVIGYFSLLVLMFLNWWFIDNQNLATSLFGLIVYGFIKLERIEQELTNYFLYSFKLYKYFSNTIFILILLSAFLFFIDFNNKYLNILTNAILVVIWTANSSKKVHKFFCSKSN